MNQLTVITDHDNSGAAFDALLKHPLLLKDTDDPVSVVIKNDGTKEGSACAMIVFPVVQKDGTVALAQTVTTVRLLKAALKILEQTHPHL